MERNPGFLKNKYPSFHTDPEVDKVAERLKRGADHLIEPVRNALRPQINQMLQDPSIRIQNYLNELKDSLDSKNPRRGEKIQRIKQALHEKFVIKPQDFSESYFATQRRLVRERGQGDIEITPEMRDQLMDPIIADQKSSLNSWIDYLSTPDAAGAYPDWFRYWAMRSVTDLCQYDKEKKQFDKRRRDTVKPFPDLQQDALAFVLDAMIKKYAGELSTLPLNDVEQERLELLLEDGKESFAKLYAFAIEKFKPATAEELKNTAGQWVKYPQGSDYEPLVQGLQGHSTNWCTAGEATAQKHLASGDFYVYYSNDNNGSPRIPRAAIRMEGEEVAEVRGIAKEQNLDPYIGEVVGAKMKEFPDGALYEQKTSDMKRLTELERTTKAGGELNREELVFLYEIDRSIQGFGYQKDPRVKEIRASRDVVQDQCLVFNCTPQQIARNISEIAPETKAFVGYLSAGIFAKLTNIEHIYTRFPEERVRKEDLVVGGKTKVQLEQEMKESGSQIGSYAQQIMESEDFKPSLRAEQMQFIRLTVASLFGDGAASTTEQIYKRIKELGLELCPPETGPEYRLQYKNQPMGECLRIGMKQIFGVDGSPRAFDVEHDGDGLWLGGGQWGALGDEWYPEALFLFRLHKLES